MDLGKLAGNLLKSDAGKKIVSKATKAVASNAGTNISSLVGLATKNADVVGLLGKIGALKGVVEPEASKSQALVSKLFTLVKKTTGLKIDEEMFSKIVTKVLSSDTVKKKVEKLAGTTGSVAFIKKAISCFVG